MTETRDFARMRRARRFPENTCPASRHAALTAAALNRDDPHTAESIASVVASLWQARTALHRLGYECRADKSGRQRWVRR